MEKIETAAQERAAELAESQRRAAQQEEGVRELKDSLTALEACLPGVKLEARLSSIERSVGGLKGLDLVHKVADRDWSTGPGPGANQGKAVWARFFDFPA